MIWEYDKNGYWISDKPYGDGVSDFIYTIYGNETDGYTAEACNNAYGAERVAVKNKNCKNPSKFKSLSNLKKRIENGTQLWLYTGYCSDNILGEVTTKEY